jgi:hypothetical protein
MVSYWDEALRVCATFDGGALIGAYYEEGDKDWDWTLICLDSNGKALWQRVYEYSWDWPNAVQQLSNGGFMPIHFSLLPSQEWGSPTIGRAWRTRSRIVAPSPGPSVGFAASGLRDPRLEEDCHGRSCRHAKSLS